MRRDEGRRNAVISGVFGPYRRVSADRVRNRVATGKMLNPGGCRGVAGCWNGEENGLIFPGVSGLGFQADSAARSASPGAARVVNRNPAWALLAFLRGGFVRGRLVWGLGLPDARIDLDGIAAWAAWCDAHTPPLRVSLVLDRPLQVADLIRTICQCGRASPSWASGKLGVVWEDSATPVTALVHPGNIVQGSLRVVWSGEEPADEIAVRYIDPDSDWQWQTIRRAMPGVSTPSRTATITLAGVTDGAQAAMEANLQAARQLYHRRRIAWEMSSEGLSIARGDVVRITHGLIDGGITGRMAAIETATTPPVAGQTQERWTLGRTITVPAGQTWYALLRLPDGSLHTSRITEDGADRLRPDDPLPDGWNTGGAQAADILWRVYPGDSPPAPVRIVSVEPVSESRVRFEAIDEDPRYHAAAASDLTVPLPLPAKQSPRVVYAAVEEQESAGGPTEITLRLTVAGPWRGADVRTETGGLWRTTARLTDGATVASWSGGAAPIDRIEITPGSRAAPTGPVYTLTRLDGGALSDLSDRRPAAGTPAPPVVAGVTLAVQGSDIIATLALFHPAPEAVSAFDVRLHGPGAVTSRALARRRQSGSDR